MKKIIFILLYSVFSTIYSQSKNPNLVQVEGNSFIADIKIPNVKYVDTKKGKFIERNYYEFEDYSKAGDYILPSFHYVFALPANTKPKISVIGKEGSSYHNTIPTVNPSLKKVNDSTLVEEYSSNSITAIASNHDDFEIESYFWYRDFYCVSIKINSYKFDQQKNEIRSINSIKLKFTLSNNVSLLKQSNIKIKGSFDSEVKKLLFNSDIAEQFRASKQRKQLSDSTYKWINFNSNYIKISIVQDGIFKITGNDIANAGYNISSITPNTFQLFESGKEVPIIIDDGGDGVFDDIDFIEFWGHKNYSRISNRVINGDNEEYNEYLNRYTDTTYYFLTWGMGIGKRISLSTDFISNLNDTLNYYTDLFHVEENNMAQNLNSNEVENQTANWNKNKSWYWNWLGNWNSPVKFNFSLTNLVPDKEANIFFKAVSGGSNIVQNAHQVKLEVNGITIDSQNVNRNV